jgi:hypothetical protein
MESFGYHDSNIYDLLENRHYNVRQVLLTFYDELDDVFVFVD